MIKAVSTVNRKNTYGVIVVTDKKSIICADFDSLSKAISTTHLKEFLLVKNGLKYKRFFTFSKLRSFIQENNIKLIKEA